MDGRPNRRNKAAFSNFSGVVWALRYTENLVPRVSLVLERDGTDRGEILGARFKTFDRASKRLINPLTIGDRFFTLSAFPMEKLQVCDRRITVKIKICVQKTADVSHLTPASLGELLSLLTNFR